MKKIPLTILLLLTVLWSACATTAASKSPNAYVESTVVAKLVNQGLTAAMPSDVSGQGSTPTGGQQPPSGDQGMGTPSADGGPMRGGGIQLQLLEATKSAS